MRPKSLLTIRIATFFAALLPLLWLVYRGYQTSTGIGKGLGVNPVETITHTTGKYALYILLATLAITPLRQLTGQAWLIKLRRQLGLWAFAYGCLHFTTYMFDQAFDVQAILKDVVKRPYITAGTLALMLMLPLAVTSTQKMIRRLGKGWQSLHRLIYGSAFLGVIHYVWLVKADLRKPIFCGVVLFGLMLGRMYLWNRAARRGGAS
jgi:sulfoxide reductase heme-binding subunit YedZ